MKTIFLILLISVFALGAQITDDKLQVGKPTSSGDKILEFKGPTSKRLKRNVSTNELSYDGDAIKLGDGTNTEKKITFDKGANSPVMRWNNATSKLEFSNDGTIYKAFGSGSGSGSGGVNLLPNPGFEDGLTGYTNTGGTVAVVDTGSNLLFDLKSVTFTATAGSQNFRSDAIAIPEGLKGQNCLVKLTYKGGDSNLTLSVTDGSDVQIPNSQAPTVIASSIAKEISASFICPNSGSVKWKLSSGAAAALIALDNVHLGSNIDVFQVSQAAHIGTLKYAAATNCQWTLTSATYTSYSADTDCATPTTTGGLSIPSTKIPAFKMVVNSGDIYRITAKSQFNGSGNYISFWRFFDGTDATEQGGISYGSTGVVEGQSGVITAIYKPTTSGEKTIEIQGKSDTGSYATRIQLEGASDLIFEVERFPSQSQLAVNMADADFDLKDMGAIEVRGSTSDPTKGSIVRDKVWLSRKGELAQIEMQYHQNAAGANGSGYYIYKLPAGLTFKSTIIPAPGTLPTNTPAAYKVGTAVFHNHSISASPCDALALDSDEFVIVCQNAWNGSAVYEYGLTDLSFGISLLAPIEGWTANGRAPILVGTVSSGTAGMLRVEYATVSSAGVVSNESSDWINGDASLSDTSLYAFTLNAGFSSAPVCWGHSKDTANFDTYLTINPTSSTAVTVRTGNHLPSVSQQKIAAAFDLICIGPK